MELHEFEKQAISELDAVYRFARFLTGNAAQAEDLVQDVYARAFRPESVSGFGARGAGMRPWLMTIARTTFYSRLERDRAGQRAMDHMTQSLSAAAQESEAPSPSQVEGIDWASVGPALGDAIGALSVELREVLWLWAVEGMKYREIGQAMGVPIGTVMSRLHRARTQAAAAIIANPPILAELRQARIGGAAGAPARGGHKHR
jgi:RNA polymerase sigma-70 factor, ECF subfamily